jgi:tRNA(Ile)-lysidine synthase TilS/MesJ
MSKKTISSGCQFKNYHFDVGLKNYNKLSLEHVQKFCKTTPILDF